MSFLARNIAGLLLIGVSGATGHLADIQDAATVNEKAHRLDKIVIEPTYEKGNCDSLEELFRWHGITDEESAFFFGRSILWRESHCGGDTYNESSGDTGVCQLTHLHSKPGYYGGKYYPNGWAVDLFGLYVGKAHGGFMRDHPNHIEACLWLLRGGNFEPGIVDPNPWKASW